MGGLDSTNSDRIERPVWEKLPRSLNSYAARAQFLHLHSPQSRKSALSATGLLDHRAANVRFEIGQICLSE